MTMPNPLRVLVVTLALALASSLLVFVGGLTDKAQAQTEPPRGIGGEAFALSTPDRTSPDLTVTGTCDRSFISRLNFQASGVATGPYPGTFEETGTVELGPLNSTGSTQPVRSVTANFTIDSPNGQVTGTKEFVTGSTGNGNCQELFDGSLSASAFNQKLHVVATIETPDGRTCTTTGAASLSFVKNSGVLPDSFTENFLNVAPFDPPTCEGPEDTTAPSTQVALDPASPNGQNGWYTSAVHATISANDGSGSGVAETRCVLDPASPPDSFDDLPSSPCPYLGSGASVSADGQHTLYAASIDAEGNKETPVVSKQFKIDTRAPAMSGSYGPATLKPPNHKLVKITSSIRVSDGGSGLDGSGVECLELHDTSCFRLLSVTSNQADSGLGPGDEPGDILDWRTGTNDTSGLLRAERYGTDRIYTLTYQAKDKAGNTRTRQLPVTVPKG